MIVFLVYHKLDVNLTNTSKSRKFHPPTTCKIACASTLAAIVIVAFTLIVNNGEQVSSLFGVRVAAAGTVAAIIKHVVCRCAAGGARAVTRDAASPQRALAGTPASLSLAPTTNTLRTIPTSL